MKKLLLFLALFLFFVSAQCQDLKILVVTGGHKFDRESFFAMFDSMDGIQYEEAIQPRANEMIASGAADQYDVLVFYDMYQEISPDQKEALLKLLKQGQPMLFFHHSLVSYQNWPEFEKIIGGRYFDETRYKGTPEDGFSTYQHDTDIPMHIMAENHPATKGLADFVLFDEVYGNTVVLPGVIPLVGTNHPKSTPVISWENHYGNATIIYIQPGHGKSCFENANYRRLMEQSIKYLAESN